MLKRVCLIAGVFALAVSAAGPADLLAGTWKMNVARSEFKPGPAPKSVVTKYSLDGDWLVSTSDSVDAEGKKATRSNRVKMDGKEHAYTGPSGTGTIRMQSAGDRRYTSVTKTGKGTMTSESTISADGRTRTQTGSGTNAQGTPSSNKIVWEKQ